MVDSDTRRPIPRRLRLYGMTREQVIGKTIDEVFGAAAASRSRRPAESLSASGRALPIRADGQATRRLRRWRRLRPASPARRAASSSARTT